jgi:TolA-binding protein
LNDQKGTHQETVEPTVKSEDLSSEEPKVVEAKKSNEMVAAPASSQYGMEEMRAELAKLTGKVEEMEQEKKSQLAAQAEEQTKLRAKIEELEKQIKEKEEVNKGPVVPEGKTALQAAKDAFFSKKYEEAIQYLDSFLKEKDHGKDAEEGFFIRAESYFRLKQFKKAIVDYSQFPEKFTKSNYHSKALLKIAESFESLNLKEDAKAFYQDLADKFPKTVEGKLAKKKLTGKNSKK